MKSLLLVALFACNTAHAIGCERIEYAEIKDMTDAQLAEKIETMDQLGKTKSASLEDQAQCSHEAARLSLIRMDRLVRESQAKQATQQKPQ
jgi:hypothetical protein